MPQLDRRAFTRALTLSALVPGLPLRAAAALEPRPVELLEPVWIPVSAGLKLAGRIWLPKGGQQERFPVVLEYIPYRTFDRYRMLDDYWGQALAGRGIAFARIDIRGSGNSEGLLLDEYLASEQQDAKDIIAWLAAQPWCNGSVGMRGISWGGFSTLQVAAGRPPALKAIMPMCATDMRFANDAHYVGGLPGLTNLKWAAGFELVMAAPPDPAVVGQRWEAMWQARLEAVPSIAARWLRHDTNDGYWRHGSVGLDPQSIACPTYLVDGWADSYTSSALRLLEHLRVPRKAVIGPWGHIYPQFARPGPGLDWIEEEERWWKHWLSGEANGVMETPLLQYHIAEKTPAETAMGLIPGRWAAERAWPSPQIDDLILHLAPGKLSDSPVRGRLSYRSNKLVGLASPEWIPYAEAELPREQSEDDARSLVFDLPLTSARDVVGHPRLQLQLRCDQPLGTVAARLCEVDPQGRSWLISYGILNLAFRKGLEVEPSPLQPGRSYRLVLELSPLAHRLKPGHTLRLALSDGLWPLAWPSPEAPELEFDLAGCHLVLPVRATQAAEPGLSIREKTIDLPRSNPRLSIREAPGGRVDVSGAWDLSTSKVGSEGTEVSGSGPDMELSYDPADRTSCRWLVRQASGYRRDGWNCETKVEIEMTAGPSSFTVRETLSAFKDGIKIFGKTRSDDIARRFS